MTQPNQIYKCNVCGNIVEVLHAGAGELVCCDQPMKLQKAKTQDPKLSEKHVPVIDFEKDIIRIGKVPHPMEEKHYIEWIEIIYRNEFISRKVLGSNQKPQINFKLKNLDKTQLKVKAYCNLHGLWEA